MGVSVTYDGSGLMRITLDVHIEPVAQGRPRFARRGSFVQTYDPPKSRDYKQTIRLYAQEVFQQIPSFKPFDSAIDVSITVRRSIPKSFSKKAKQSAAKGELRPTTKPDVENYSKGICDALNGVLWKDDSRITDLTVRKVYAESPGIEVVVTDLSSPAV